MSIEKVNLYIPGRDLTNLALNVDYDRLGFDLTDITIQSNNPNPTEIVIKQGSMWECNGNRYKVTGGDYVFYSSDLSKKYLVFTDNPTPAFSMASVPGTFNAVKQGYYQADNITRTLKWIIDCDIIGSEYFAIESVRANFGHKENIQSKIVSAERVDSYKTRYTETTLPDTISRTLTGSTGAGTYRSTGILKVYKPIGVLVQANVNYPVSPSPYIIPSVEILYNNGASAETWEAFMGQVTPGLTYLGLGDNRSILTTLPPGQYKVKIVVSGGTVNFSTPGYVRIKVYSVYGDEYLDNTAFEVV